MLAHRSLLATATSGSVIAAIVAGVAVVSTGYTAQRLDLGDASVWLSNSSQQAIGRANTEVHELDSVVAGAGSDIDMLQAANVVLVVDHGTSKVDIVDPATSTISETVPLPPQRPQVFITDDTAVILAQTTGELWMVPLTGLASFDSETPPTLSLGTDAIASMDDDGLMFAYSPSSSQVYRIQPDLSDAVQATDAVQIPASSALSISSVGGEWAILDAIGSVVYSESGPAALGDRIRGAVIQRPSTGGDRLLLAAPSALIGVDLATGDVGTISSGQAGTPARPLFDDGCVFAAWTSGQAFRRCAADPADGLIMPLPEMAVSSLLEFRSNDGRVLLNDVRSGAAWAVQDSGEVIDNWADLIKPEESEQQEQNDEDVPPDLDKSQLPPVTVDDDFGARPGRATVLPVLLNDYDPNGDVLLISDVVAIDESVGRIDLISDQQQLQLTLSEQATGVVTFRYTVSDGRGGTASSLVEVTVRKPSENSAPEQVRTTKGVVASGGKLSSQVLGDWVDPDGDAFYLTDASVPAPDSLTFRPQGTVVFSDSGEGGVLKQVILVVSDGTAEGSGGIRLTVRAAGSGPIIADPFIVLATAGQETTVSPLEHVRGGTGAIRLNSVPAKSGATLTPSYDAGTFRFASEEVGTHYLDYVVTDGDLSATGLVRVDVIAPADANLRPITIPKTVFVKSLRTENVDVAGSDIDPAGGVLLVTGLMNLPTGSGVSAEVLEQRIVRVRLDAPLDGPVTFNYRISNGLAEAEGVVTVIEIPTPRRLPPPVAKDDAITVRVGAAIDIPVLANDEQPDGEELTLLPTLPKNLPDGAGLLFGSDRVLRYLAPQVTGNFTAVYEVVGSDGQRSRAQVRIAVREPDVNTNNPPVPNPITARALAGETVTIKVPLSGIDPDGDSVQLLGQESNPEKGAVVKVEADSITYRAGDYSAGTDSFSYTVVDALGARATGTVRVGISARLGGARNPVAAVDEVTVRPGVTVSVQVLANDSDPDGRPLKVVAAEPNDPLTTATFTDDLVSIRPPGEEGTYGVIYTIDNGVGGTSSTFVRVSVDANAPLSYPEARDTVLTLTDVLDHETVDVDVLASVFFADGDPGDLELTVYQGYGDTARVTSGKRIRITVTDDSQIIPFRVTHPDDSKVYSYAFIWVPGFNDALPQLNRDAPPLTVISEEQLIIDLSDRVLAVGGKGVRLTDTSSVRATHGNGDDLVIDKDTLVFTSADRYFGAASISFEVTDGESAADPNGRTTTLVLPILVLARANQPPAFAGAVLEFEPAQEKKIDLVRLTNYPYPADVGELEFTVLSPLPEGFTYALDGQRLTLRANEAVLGGSTTSLSVGVRDGQGDGQAGRIELSIVPSTRPLAIPATDLAETTRGETTIVDVLSNDAATNPFPDTPLRVVAIRGLDGSLLPDGVSISPSEDRSELTIEVDKGAEPTETSLQYQVADATGDPARFVWGTIRISVQDRPDQVSAVRVTEFGNRRLTVSWNGAPANNSAITGYLVTLIDAASGQPLGTTDCAGTQCEVETPGNGPDNAVFISVIAQNAIGDSDAAQSVSPTWSDVVPAPPTNLAATPLDHGLRITWAKPAGSGGSEITRYLISVDGLPAEEFTVSADDAVGTSYVRNIVSPSGLSNGATVAFSVSARNSAANSLAQWNKATASGQPAGAPQRLSAPKAVANIGEGTSATLAWPESFSSNGRSISGYYAAMYTGTAPSCIIAGSLPGTPVIQPNGAIIKKLGTATAATFVTDPNKTYKFVVFASNGMGCVASTVVEATPRAFPGTVTDLQASISTSPNSVGGAIWDYRLDGFSVDGAAATSAYTFYYRLSGGTVENGSHGQNAIGSLLTSSDGSQYGQTVSVQLKACRNYPDVPQPLCSQNWSTPVLLGVPVQSVPPAGLSFTQTPNPPVLPPDPSLPVAGSYNWSVPPSLASYASITYSCGGAQQTFTGSPPSCDVTATTTATRADGFTVGTAFPDFTVTITANGKQFVRTYQWQNYD